MRVNLDKDPDDSESPTYLTDTPPVLLNFQELRKIANWFTPINFRTIQTDTFSKHTPGTGLWFIKSPKYQTWLSNDSTLLCAQGLRKYRLALSLISDHC
jgi:hypothetical protein